jgi:hypothetical protein
MRDGLADDCKGRVDDDAALGVLVVQACGVGTVSWELPELAARPALISFCRCRSLGTPRSMSPMGLPLEGPPIDAAIS